MANLQIKNMDDDFYKKIKALADAENRSVSQQVIFLVKDYLLTQVCQIRGVRGEILAKLSHGITITY